MSLASWNSHPVRVFKRPVRPDGSSARIPEFFGENVFDLQDMEKRLVRSDMEKIQQLMRQGGQLDLELAERLACAVREWATEKGATHFCHWFQPQTGDTAEKQESFVGFDSQGEPVERLTGKELLQGEPDASSFPSGGIRSTFEARGYTGWDPTSPMFLMDSENGSTLYIPSVFISHTGDALDFKVPLLRSLEQINREATRTLHLLGEKHISSVNVTVGSEQEFFLIERSLAALRPDILVTGRTVFGRMPAKGQELEDHYFGSIPPRVTAFLEEVEVELYRVGVPVRTRHNEVAPRQFELAPIFESANIAADHNQLLMKVLKTVAARHDFAVLLHEKPFEGINGSGKHVNWSLQDSSGRNLLEPGRTPVDNITFLTVLIGVLDGIWRHGDVIRASIASAGNDHRLGANEAPPAIMSAFLGEQLEAALNQLESGNRISNSGEKTLIDLGINRLQNLLKDNTDRNRTSPFAFTGNKFEFRAVGSNASIAYPTAVLTAAVTDGLRRINNILEKELKNGHVPPEVVLSTLRDFIRESKAVRFEGNGYSGNWTDEAKRRGLNNFPTSAHSLVGIVAREKTAFLRDLNILSEREIESRVTVQLERYVKARAIEFNIGAEMILTGILPAGLEYLNKLVTLSTQTTAQGISSPALPLAKQVGELCNRIYTLVSELQRESEALIADGSLDHEKVAQTALSVAERVMPLFQNLRKEVDALEGLAPESAWPFPQYAQILFGLEI